MNFFTSLIFLIIVGSLASQYAKAKGRDPLRWFVIGMLFSLFGLLVLFLLPDLSGKNEVRPKQNPNFVDSEEELLELRPVEWSKEWYYVNTGKQSVGPVSMSTLVKLWKAGQIQLATLVWSEGMDGWKKIEDLRSLKTCLDKD